MAATTELASTLSETPLFSGLEQGELQLIAEAMRPVAFKSGQSIFGRGDFGSELYVVREGRVKVSVLTAEGRELAFSHIRKGELFGEIAMLDGGERTADATALSAVKAMSLSRTALDDAIRRAPALADNIIRFLCRRLRETDLQFEGIALHRIEARLARYFDVLCRQAAPDQDEGIVEINVPISQGELATLLGASRPKVNGALSLLESDGTVTRDGTTYQCRVENLRMIGELE